MPNNKNLFLPLITLSALLMGGCSAPQPVSTPAKDNVLEVAPQLSRYTRFELFSQASTVSAEQKAVGSLDFKTSSSSFEVRTDGNQTVERLFVQSEVCRDDPSPDCQRRFVVSGRLTALGTTLNCYIPVRNDTSMGYAGQSLAGICQDRNGRSFSISIFAN